MSYIREKFNIYAENVPSDDHYADYDSYKAGYAQGRADMHNLVMTEWDKPYQQTAKENNGMVVHIGTRLKGLK